ncbi:MAG: hypothetical protein JWM85_2113 [Acidimicrobiaceae bacterium]|nr:hypothetical protein [Acidimicrobiaceae bacterium]
MPAPDNPNFPGVVPLAPVDLSGGASTTADQMTTGGASVAKAIRGSLGAPGSQSHTSLLDAYSSWREREAAASEATKAKSDTRTPAEVEASLDARAMRKSARRLAKHLREGASPAVAGVRAHEHYKKHGGKSSHAVWARKIARG